MTHVDFADEILDRLRERHPRFHPRAYAFVMSALHEVMEGLGEPRHISAEELAHGARRLALHHFGLTARTVLGHWGIHSTQDLGEVVFALVEAEVLVRQEGDRLEDFRGVYDFGDVFETNYPWAAGARSRGTGEQAAGSTDPGRSGPAH
ncbi:MAG: hypothetical protein EA352_07090 [Gemmatimonadales bacterium]|nr:MAG: hypothetical protein EA352_07090 [Gemmatimonadales bacterium]